MFLGTNNFTYKAPHLLDAVNILGNAHRCRNHLGAATTCFDAVYSLSFGLHPLSHFPDRPHPFSQVNRIKMLWDEEQHAYLTSLAKAKDGGLGRATAPPVAVRDTLAALADFHGKARAKFDTLAPKNDWSSLRAPYEGTVSNYFNKAFHIRGAPPAGHPIMKINPLNPELNLHDLEQTYLRNELVVVDSILRPEVLAELRHFALESTIYQDSHKRSYTGAYWSPVMPTGDKPNKAIWMAPNHSGFSHPLLLHVVAALQGAFSFITPHFLQQMWVYAYLQKMGGTTTNQGIGVHADEAAVNINMWLTPDDANLDPGKGGLRVWPKAPPTKWSFREYNSPEHEKRNLKWLESVLPVDVPYRMNRAVIFNSFFFHKTLPNRFKAGHANRRINLTFLFGSHVKGSCT